MVIFGNDGGARVLGHGILTNGGVTIKKVSHVEGLEYNLLNVYRLKLYPISRLM